MKENIEKTLISIGKSCDSRLNSDINSYLRQITRFHRLQKLNLTLTQTSYSLKENYEKTLISIGKSCEQLTQFKILIKTDSIIHFNKSIFEILVEFRELQKLEISLFDIKCAKNGSIASLKNLKYLRKLELSLNDLNDSHLQNIHLFLPNLNEIGIGKRNLIQNLKYLI